MKFTESGKEFHQLTTRSQNKIGSNYDILKQLVDESTSTVIGAECKRITQINRQNRVLFCSIKRGLLST